MRPTHCGFTKTAKRHRKRSTRVAYNIQHVARNNHPPSCATQRLPRTVRAIGVPNHATCNKQPIATCNGSHTNVPSAPTANPTPRSMRHCGGDGSAQHTPLQHATCDVHTRQTRARTPLVFEMLPPLNVTVPPPMKTTPPHCAQPAQPCRPQSAPHPVRRPHPSAPFLLRC